MPKLLVNFDASYPGFHVPYDHQYLLYSSLLNGMRESDRELSLLIHTEKTLPLFAMSQLIPGGKRKFSREGIEAERFVLMFTGSKKDVLTRMAEAISRSGNLTVGTSILKYHSSRIVEIPVPPTVPRMVTRSPVILRDHDRYVSFGDPEFVEILKSKVTAKAERVGNSHGTKIRFLRVLEGKRKSISIKAGKVTCSFLKFIIDADQDLLKTILTYGIGAKTQMGFGMIEVGE